MPGNQTGGVGNHFFRLQEIAGRVNPSLVASVAFVLAGTVLACLELVVWKEFIGPHANLVRCTSVDAVVTELRLEEVGPGPYGSVFPRVTYQFMLDGKPVESSVIRHPRSVQSEGAEGNVGEIRFQGSQRKQWAGEYLAKYRVGQRVTAWVTLSQPVEAMLIRQELDVQPFLMGLVPVIFVPFLWMFFCHLLLAFTGRPMARWIGCGWATLTLSSLYPVLWQYQQLLDPGQSSLFVRVQEVGLNLTLVVFGISFLPATFRSGIGIGLTLCVFLGIGIGVARTVYAESFKPQTAWKGDSFLLLVQSAEFGLYCGCALGLLIGVLARRGLIWILPCDEEQFPFDTK